MTPPADPIVALLRPFAAACERMRLPYYVSGSVAGMIYGEVRMTQDVDIVVELPSWKAAELCAAFPPPEYYVSVDAAKEAAMNGGQFNILHPSSGLKIDVMMVDDSGYSASRLGRARRIKLDEGFEPFFAAPEDVILMKLVYYQEGGSDKHVRDIASMLKISGPDIDRAYIEQWAPRIGVLAVWRQVLAEIEKRRGG